MVGALHGIRVVDFGQYLAGPLLGVLLADNGAEVIRVDPPGGPRWKHVANAVLQRGKHSLVLDLKRPTDRAMTLFAQEVLPVLRAEAEKVEAERKAVSAGG